MRLNRHCAGYDAWLQVFKGLNKSWFSFVIFSLLIKLNIERTTALFANAHVYEVDLDVLVCITGSRAVSTLENHEHLWGDGCELKLTERFWRERLCWRDQSRSC